MMLTDDECDAFDRADPLRALRRRFAWPHDPRHGRPTTSSPTCAVIRSG